MFKMRAFLAVAFATSLAAAQSLSGLPQCAQSCVTNYGSCSAVDVKCICSNTEYVDNLSCCVYKACGTADQEKTLQFAQSLCGAAGVKGSLPTSASCAATATGSTTSMSMSMTTTGAMTNGTMTGTHKDTDTAGAKMNDHKTDATTGTDTKTATGTDMKTASGTDMMSTTGTNSATGSATDSTASSASTAGAAERVGAGAAAAVLGLVALL